MSHDFQKELVWLGATSSPAFVRAPEGNGCAERFIRTLQENMLWVRTLHTVEDLRLAPIEFRHIRTLVDRAAWPLLARPVPMRSDGHVSIGRIVIIGCFKARGRYRLVVPQGTTQTARLIGMLFVNHSIPDIALPCASQ
jgi:transposase InsO family protein